MEIEKIYPLSPMQEGMLFHSLLNKQSHAYFIQNIYRVGGLIDRNILEESYRLILKKYEALRVLFIHEKIQKPRQVVVRKPEIQIYYEDISQLTSEEKKRYIEDFKIRDRNKGFNLSKELALRISLLMIKERSHILIWSYHHILMDGWCLHIILYDLLRKYQLLCQGKTVILEPVTPYQEYVEWLEKQDKERAMLFWQDYLQGYSRPATLPLSTNSAYPGDYQPEVCNFWLEREVGEGLQVMSKRYQVTLNSLFKVVWAILLQHYNCSDDVAFGIVVSGRSSEVEGIENMVGLFVNTIPVRVQVTGMEPVFQLIQTVHRTSISAKKHEYLPLADIQSVSILKGNLIDHIMIFENHPLKKEADVKTGQPQAFSVKSLENFEQTNYNFNVYIFPGELIQIRFSYNALVYHEEWIRAVARHFQMIFQQVVRDPHRAVNEIEILEGEERHKVLIKFNKTKVKFSEVKRIHEFFLERSRKVPEKIALSVPAVGNNHHLSYRQLNRQSCRLARILKTRGVVSGHIVAVMMKRSAETLTVILGVLMVGGAYLPIDSQYPKERIEYILSDSGTAILLVDNHESLPPALNQGSPWITVEIQPEINPNRPKGVDPVFVSVNPYDGSIHSSLAYVIYTSGSTGRPKGTLVEHHSVVNILTNLGQLYPLTGRDAYLFKTNYTFDVSVTELFGWFFGSGRLVVLDVGEEKEPAAIADTICRLQVTHINFVPSMLKAFLDAVLDLGLTEQLKSLRWIMVAGEAFSRSLFLKATLLNLPVRFENIFGPTEATIYTTRYALNLKEELEVIPIGKPLNNIEVYVSDQWMRLQPIYVVGELYIGGAGVSRGYLNNPELTAANFIRSPMKSDNCLYRSGDLARWLPDGNIEFLGRKDRQVKIRGFRIEPDEVTNQLIQHEAIREAFVSELKDDDDDGYLCAYVVPSDPEVEDQLDPLLLRKYLLGMLPYYMIPSFFIPLEEIPLTPAGKIDHQRLPHPLEKTIRKETDYVAPCSRIEKELAEIWRQVLGRKEVGLNHNFFLIGGDSIKAIQIISRMNKAGYKIEMRDLFLSPTIAKLAPLIQRLDRVADQSPVTGRVPLVPIQHEFFEKSGIETHHFNQAVMLWSRERLEEKAVRAIFRKIGEHHDALRMTFKREKGEIVQTNHGLIYPLSLQVSDFRGRGDARSELTAEAEVIQAGIDLENGPLMKLALFRLDDGDRLLIVVHHLVIDGVSWRILFEDIESLYHQYRQGFSFTLPLKTDSFKKWAETLNHYANLNGEFLEEERRYWMKLRNVDVPEIKRDFEIQTDVLNDSTSLSFRLSEEETSLLLTSANEAFTTEINDILLTALGMGIYTTFGHYRMLVALEGHGRQDILEDVNISRTVGWFTNIYPVLLEISAPNRLSDQIKNVKEMLRRIPRKGIGYGILKYLTTGKRKWKIGQKKSPWIRFNYLGQFDRDVDQMSAFQMASESYGSLQSQARTREYPFDVSGMINHRRLIMTIVFNKKHFKSATIETFLRNFRAELSRIIEYCCRQQRHRLSPSDLTFQELSIETLEQLEERYAIEDIYTLSPMQEGMLFQSLYNEASSAYFEQISFRLQGVLNISLMEKGLRELFKRHDILRTVFIYEGMEIPLQVVLRERQIDFRCLDICHLTERSEKEIFIEAYKEDDRQRTFDLSRDVLMRVAAIQIGVREYEFVWSHHHILMDRWCVGILITEFLEIYHSLCHQRAFRLPPVIPYKTYINWLSQRKQEDSIAFWLDYLSGYSEPISLPGKEYGVKNHNGYHSDQVAFVIEVEEMERLTQLTGHNQVTLNTLFQTVWALILGLYTGKKDLVFGGVVSGRPAEIVGVEKIVGLFINTIPVRIAFDEHMTFLDLLKKVQQRALECEPHHYCPLAEIQSRIPLRQDLLDHIVVFQNIPISVLVKKDALTDKRVGAESLRLLRFKSFDHSNYNLSIVVTPGDRITVSLNFNSHIYEKKKLDKVACHFQWILRQIVARENLYIHEFTLLPEGERTRLLKKVRHRMGKKETIGPVAHHQKGHKLDADFIF